MFWNHELDVCKRTERAHENTHDTSERLQEHEGKTNSHAVASASLEQLHELLLLGHLKSTPLFDLLADLAHLAHDVFVIAGQTTEIAKNLFGRFEIVLTCKPARRLGADEEHPKTEEETRSELQSKRDDILSHAVGRDVLICAVVDPEA